MRPVESFESAVVEAEADRVEDPCLVAADRARELDERLETGHVLRFAPGTQQIIGLTVSNARQVVNRDGRLIVTIPEIAEASAGDLAAALQAA